MVPEMWEEMMNRSNKTIPMHPAARRFHQEKFFNDISTFKELEEKISELRTNSERGDAKWD
jgi:hypothetical protein